MDDLQTHPSEEFLASTGDLTGLLSLEESTDEALQRVTDLASKLVISADGVGITLVSWPASSEKPVFRTAAYSDHWVKTVDLQQYETHEGPCVDATIRCEVVNLPSLDDPRYPAFCGRAKAEGLGSVLAVPLNISETAVGALNLYSRSAGAFELAEETITRHFAAQAAVALVNVELYEGARALTRQLGDAMESRSLIEQAKGILMGREKCTSDEAFERLKTMSQAQNIKVQDIAGTIVEGATHP